MDRYFDEVKKVDRGEMSPKEFTQRIFGELDWARAWAAARVYLEDGGERYGFEEFVEQCQVKVPEEIADAWPEFLSSKA